MDTTEIQREARALGDPTRHRLFRYIANAGRPVGVAELTTYVGLNHNAVRQHLGVLKEAELITEGTEIPTRPGRPSLLYQLHPEAAGKWETAGPYAWLAGLLAEAVKHNWSPRQAGKNEGLRRGLTHRADEDPVDAIELELLRNGFRPTRKHRGSQTEFVLGRCPFVEVAATNPEAVCQLHLGLAEGLAESLQHIKVDGLTIRNARKAGCRLVVEHVAEGSRKTR